jgi:hypothetical protein
VSKRSGTTIDAKTDCLEWQARIDWNGDSKWSENWIGGISLQSGEQLFSKLVERQSVDSICGRKTRFGCCLVSRRFVLKRSDI